MGKEMEMETGMEMAITHRHGHRPSAWPSPIGMAIAITILGGPMHRADPYGSAAALIRAYSDADFRNTL